MSVDSFSFRASNAQEAYSGDSNCHDPIGRGAGENSLELDLNTGEHLWWIPNGDTDGSVSKSAACEEFAKCGDSPIGTAVSEYLSHLRMPVILRCLKSRPFVARL